MRPLLTWCFILLLTVSGAIPVPEVGGNQKALEKQIPLNVVNLGKELLRQGIDQWEVVLAQGITEAGWSFSSDVCRNANNFIGMRVPGGRPSTRIGTYKGYSKYETWQDCVRDIKLWQEQNWYGGSRSAYINMMHRIWAESPIYRLALLTISNRIDRMIEKYIQHNKNHFNFFILSTYLNYYEYRKP